MANSPNSPSFSRGRKWAFGFQVIIAVASLLAIILMLNYLAARHFWRFDLTGQGNQGLSPQTLRVLRSITNDVKVTVFFEKDAEPELYDLTTALLREYNFANPHITVKTVDPTRRPAEAEMLLSSYKLTGLKDKNFVIFDCDGHSQVVYQNELADYDINAVLSGQSKEFKRKSFKGELQFTTTIFNLANPREFKVYFLAGHGEHDPEKSEHPHGYAKFAAILSEKSNAKFEKLTLLGTNEVPTDCQLLVIAGPRLPISDLELAKVDRYLQQGGRLFALMGNLAYSGNVSSGLEKLLNQWGIGVANDMVFDPKNSPTGNDLLTAQINNEHPVMRALLVGNEDLRIRLVLPRAVGQSTTYTNSTANPDAPKVVVLAATGPSGEEASEIRDGVPYRNPYSDHVGVFPLIVAAEQGRVRDITAERGSMRMIVVGDSLCLDNELIDNAPANHFFAGLAVDWLLDRPQVLLEGLVPRPINKYQLMMTQHEDRIVRWIFLAGLPGIVLIFGGLVWLRRRK